MVHFKLTSLICGILTLSSTPLVNAVTCPSSLVPTARILKNYQLAQSYCTSKYPLAATTIHVQENMAPGNTRKLMLRAAGTTTLTVTTTVATTTSTSTSTVFATVFVTVTAPTSTSTVSVVGSKSTVTVVGSSGASSATIVNGGTGPQFSVVGRMAKDPKKRAILSSTTTTATTTTTFQQSSSISDTKPFSTPPTTTRTSTSSLDERQSIWSNLIAEPDTVIAQVCACIESQATVTEATTGLKTTSTITTQSRVVGAEPPASATSTITVTISVTATVFAVTTTTITTTSTSTVRPVTVKTVTGSTTTTTVYIKPTVGLTCSKVQPGQADDCPTGCGCASRVGGYNLCFSKYGCKPCAKDSDCAGYSIGGANPFCSNSPLVLNSCGNAACANTDGCLSRKRSTVEELFGYNAEAEAYRKRRVRSVQRSSGEPLVNVVEDLLQE